MRVLFWSDGFWPHLGGGDIVASKLVSALRENGHDIVVVTRDVAPNQPSDKYYKGVQIHRFPFWDPKSYTNIDILMEIRKSVADIRRTFMPDLVHVNGVGSSDLFHMTTAKTHPAPLLISLHGEWRYLVAGCDSLAAQTLRAGDWVAGCSEAILKLGRQLVPEIAAHSSVIYNSLELPSPRPEPLPFDPPSLLFVGRLYSPEKGCDLVLAAFASIVERFPRAHLVIAGDGPDRTGLEREVRELNITHAVEFLGWVDNDKIPSLMNAATVVVIPSRKEAFGLVALEAALMSRPAVASFVGGLPEVVVHGETGLLFEKDDSKALGDAIAYLLSHPEISVMMGQQARRRAQEVFNWKRFVEAYDMLYHKLNMDWHGNH